MPGALARAAIAAGFAVAVGVALLLATRLPSGVVALAAWDAGGSCLLVMAWITIAANSAGGTRRLASREDPGRTAVYAIVLLSAGASLLSATTLARSARSVAGARADLLVALSLVNVLICWGLTHTSFALHYAHLYYRDSEGTGGIDFPGRAAPSYFDFAYLAFTVGMTFQVSDTSVTNPQVRRAVLLHATLSFIYNTAILAFVLNLIFGVAG